MGSLRGRIRVGLAALLLTLPATASSAACWNAAGTQPSGWDELLRLVTKPLPLALFAFAGYAAFRKQRSLFAGSALLWAALALIIALDNHEQFFDDKSAMGIIEECTASPHLFIALAIAICAVMTYGALRPRT